MVLPFVPCKKTLYTAAVTVTTLTTLAYSFSHSKKLIKILYDLTFLFSKEDTAMHCQNIAKSITCTYLTGHKTQKLNTIVMHKKALTGHW